MPTKSSTCSVAGSGADKLGPQLQLQDMRTFAQTYEHLESQQVMLEAQQMGFGLDVGGIGSKKMEK